MESPMRAGLLLMIRFLTIATIIPFFSVGLRSGSPGVPCKEGQKRALLMLKNDLKDPSNRLSSWTSDGDCCNWTGVVCDHLTGHVRELRLTNPNSHQDIHESVGDNYYSYTWLGGKLNPSLLHLKHLNHLDLSYNKFQGLQIPGFFGSLKTLRYLNISEAGFQGLIPPQLGNLTNLRYLGLRDDRLKAENLEWISGLPHLKHLDMSFVNLSKASNWLKTVNMLPSLVELRMVYCQLDHIHPLLPIINFTSLSILDLFGNPFNSLMPRWVFSLTNLVSLSLKGCGFQGSVSIHPSTNTTTSLKGTDLSLDKLCELIHLDLSHNRFHGSVSEVFESLSGCSSFRIESLLLGSNNLSGHLTEHVEKFKRLIHLDLSRNSISGLIPESLGNLSHLTRLLISHNQFKGTLPEGIGQLRMLTDFDISYNFLKGIVSKVHFTHLTKLKDFKARGNSLTLKTSRDWLPPFQLQRLWLDYWHLGPDFPMWLQTQSQLVVLSLPNTGISDTIPTWFWNISLQLHTVNLSHNQMHGKLQNIVVGRHIDLSSNQFNGPLPLVSSSVRTLNLANSSLSGSLFHFFCDRMDEPKELTSLYLGDNLLTGEIPNCLMSWKWLLTLNLKGNKLTGNIPISIGYCKQMKALQLQDNHLSGELPLSMQNCSNLLLVDLGQNKLSGSLPTWIGESLSNLRVLNIRSNKLQGHVPHELCQLKSLQVLDLAHNNLSGIIPRCFNNFSAMTTTPDVYKVLLMYDTYLDNVKLVTKGREAEYGWVMLRLVVIMDLSENMISGEIPEELTNLHGLQSLNLSKNLLTGRIPSKLGNMKWLESVDLSMNQLDGGIPQSTRSLTFLSNLNLSYNNLTGEIPKSTQLQSLDQSCFIGNELCGAPPDKNCSADRMVPPTVEQDSGGGYRLLEDKWFYLSLGLGFFFGFWSVLGSLLVNMPWSILLSGFLNSIVFKLHDVVVQYM